MSAVLYDLMKKAADAVLGATNFTEIMTATVDQVDPIRLILDANSLVITSDMIVLPELYSAPNTNLQIQDKVYVIASSGRDTFFIISPDPADSRTNLVNNDGLGTIVQDKIDLSLEGLPAMIEEIVGTSAGGGNKVVRSTTPPDTASGYRSGDQWWVYSGTDETIVVGFYLHTGSVWVQQILENVILANIDAGKITSGLIAAERVLIGDAQITNVSVSKLTTGTLESDIQLAAKIQAGTDGVGLVRLDDTGIRVIDSAGVQQTAFNTTGQSVFKGDIEAEGIEAFGKVKLNSATNEISSGGILNIAGGVSAPSVAPQVTPIWNSIQLKDSTGADLKNGKNTMLIRGVTRDPNNGEWISLVYLNSSNRCVAYRHNADGTYKSTIGTFAVNATGYYDANGVALIAGEVWRGRVREVYDVNNFASDLTFQIINIAGTTRTVGTAANQSSFNPAFSIAYATSTQIVAYFVTSSFTKSTVCLFNTSTSAKSSIWSTAPGLHIMINNPVAYGDFGAGTARYGLNSGGDFRMFTLAGVEQTAENWPQAMAVSPIGFGVYGGVPWSAYSGDGKIYFYDGPDYATGSEPRFTYVLRDSKLAGTGYHESGESPVSSPSLPKRRARLRVTTSPLQTTLGDDGVDSLRVYGAFGTGQRYHQAVGVTNSYDLQTLATSGTIPGEVAAFPATSPGYIKNSTGDIILPGNGRAQLNGINIAIELGADVNLDTMTYTGLFSQSNSAEATVALDYPVSEAGMLEVVQSTLNTTMIWQRYSVYGSANEVWTRTAYNGTWYPWKKLGGGGGGSEAVVGFKAWTTTAYSLATSGHNKVANYSAELFDTNNAFNPTTGNFVVPTSGYWALIGTLPFSSSSTGRRFLQFEQGTAAAGNSANIVLLRQELSGAYATPVIYTEVSLTADQTIFMNAYQTSGGAMSCPAQNTPIVFSARYIGPTP